MLQFKNQGFTLTELLVVILIIAILVAIAAPAFLGQQDKANDLSVKQGLNISKSGIKSIFVASDEQELPPQGEIVASLQSREKEYSFVGFPEPATLANISIKRESNDSVSMCQQSVSKTFYCLLTDEGASLSILTANVNDLAYAATDVRYSTGKSEADARLALQENPANLGHIKSSPTGQATWATNLLGEPSNAGSSGDDDGGSGNGSVNNGGNTGNVRGLVPTAYWNMNDAGSVLLDAKGNYDLALTTNTNANISPEMQAEGSEGSESKAVYYPGDGQGIYSTGFNAKWFETSEQLPRTGNTFTFSVWIKEPVQYGAAGYWRSPVSVNGTQAAVMNQGAGLWGLKSSTGYSFATANPNYKAGQWNHLVFVSNGNSSDLYVNGIKQNSATVANPTTNGAFRIGGIGDETLTDGFYGWIDNVSYFDHALTALEITTLAGS